MYHIINCANLYFESANLMRFYRKAIHLDSWYKWPYCPHRQFICIAMSCYDGVIIVFSIFLVVAMLISLSSLLV